MEENPRILDLKYVSLPRTQNNHELGENINAIMNEYGFNFIEFDNYIKYNVDVKYNDFIITLTFIHNDDGIFISLIMDRDVPFEIQITKSFSLSHSYIVAIHSSRNLPTGLQRGKEIMTFIIEFLDKLGSNNITLEDQAKIDIGIPFNKVLLSHIRLFQGKPSSWYSDFGFLPNPYCNTLQLEEEIRTYPLYKLNIYDERYDTLGPYMLNLLKISPSKFIYKFDDINNGELFDKLSSIRRCNRFMIKYL